LSFRQRPARLLAAATFTRLGFRVSVSVKRHLEEAARSLGVPLTEFVLGAAQDRADQVLDAKTVVPSDYFARLVDALSAPPVANEPLRRAAERAPSVVDRTA
jgi:uncharacterized protein (DUF1778 family)